MNRLLGCVLCMLPWMESIAQMPREKLYDGREYVIIPSLISGTPFYKDAEDARSNAVCFDKVLYTEIPLLYDIRADELLATRPGELTNMVVVKEFVTFFTIGSDTIVHLNEDTTGLASGFYLQIFDSPHFKSVARYRKAVKDPRAVNEKRYYFQTVDYYLKTPASEHFVPLRNTRTLLSINKHHRKTLRKLLQTEGNREDFRVNIALVLNYLNKTEAL